MSETKLLGGRVVLRPDDRGKFDELFVCYPDAPGSAIVHFEMLSDRQLWIGISYADKPDDAVHITVSAKHKLTVETHEA